MQETINECDPETLDPLLSRDLGSIDTSLPVLAPGIHTVEIVSVEAVPRKDGTGRILRVVTKLAKDAQSIDGRTIGAGFPLYRNIGLTETERYSEEAILRALATFREAALGSKAGSLEPLSQFVGKLVRVRVKVERDSTYGTRSVIDQFVPVRTPNVGL